MKRSKRSHPTLPGNSAEVVGKRGGPPLLREAGSQDGPPAQGKTRVGGPGGLKYLTHVEVKPSEWRRIWDATAPQGPASLAAISAEIERSMAALREDITLRTFGSDYDPAQRKAKINGVHRRARKRKKTT